MRNVSALLQRTGWINLLFCTLEIVKLLTVCNSEFSKGWVNSKGTKVILYLFFQKGNQSTYQPTYQPTNLPTNLPTFQKQVNLDSFPLKLSPYFTLQIYTNK